MAELRTLGWDDAAIRRTQGAFPDRHISSQIRQRSSGRLGRLVLCSSA